MGEKNNVCHLVKDGIRQIVLREIMRIARHQLSALPVVVKMEIHPITEGKKFVIHTCKRAARNGRLLCLPTRIYLQALRDVKGQWLLLLATKGICRTPAEGRKEVMLVDALSYRPPGIFMRPVEPSTCFNRVTLNPSTPIDLDEFVALEALASLCP